MAATRIAALFAAKDKAVAEALVAQGAGGDQAVGEAKVALPSVTDGATNWATHAGCVPEPTTAAVGSDVTVTQWRGCAGGSTITFQVVDGGGHACAAPVEDSRELADAPVGDGDHGAVAADRRHGHCIIGKAGE